MAVEETFDFRDTWNSFSSTWNVIHKLYILSSMQTKMSTSLLRLGQQPVIFNVENINVHLLSVLILIVQLIN